MTDQPRSRKFARYFRNLLLFLGGTTLFLILAVFLLLVFSPFRTPGVPARVILELDLERGVIESVPEDPIGAFLRRDDLTMRSIVEALKRAESDTRVVGLVAKVGSGTLGMAQVEEVRAAVESFRATGKPAVVFAETFGEFGPGRGDYYLATAFDEIHLQPSGDVGLAGLIAEQPFLSGTMDWAGLEPRMDARHEYKDALNLLTEEGMTEPQREATLRVLTSMYENLVGGIATGRGMSAVEVTRLIDSGPYLGEEAVQARLVDRLSYRDEVYDSLKARTGGEFLYAHHYLARAGSPHRRGPTIALIYGTGTIQRGESQVDPLVGGAVMGSETITRAFREAVDSDDVRAILFRVDSPGGSYVASDAIWRETLRARNAGKPVIVTMGNVAGSGGYFVAAGADRIVAQPSTITGSIGVVGGKILIGGLAERFGVTWDDVRVGGNATMWSNISDFSPAEWERFQASLDRVYGDFTAKVAEGRGLSRDSADAVARGRIWTGTDALRLGLVDELGGFETALTRAKEAAGIDPDQSVTLRVYPRERSFLEMILEPSPSSSQSAAIEAVITAGAAARAILVRAHDLGITLSPRGVLTVPVMPDFR